MNSSSKIQPIFCLTISYWYLCKILKKKENEEVSLQQLMLRKRKLFSSPNLACFCQRIPISLYLVLHADRREHFLCCYNYCYAVSSKHNPDVIAAVKSFSSSKKLCSRADLPPSFMTTVAWGQMPEELRRNVALILSVFRIFFGKLLFPYFLHLPKNRSITFILLCAELIN